MTDKPDPRPILVDCFKVLAQSRRGQEVILRFYADMEETMTNKPGRYRVHGAVVVRDGITYVACYSVERAKKIAAALNERDALLAVAEAAERLARETLRPLALDGRSCLDPFLDRWRQIRDGNKEDSCGSARSSQE
jgi:hypothetical protein